MNSVPAVRNTEKRVAFHQHLWVQHKCDTLSRDRTKNNNEDWNLEVLLSIYKFSAFGKRRGSTFGVRIEVSHKKLIFLIIGFSLGFYSTFQKVTHRLEITFQRDARINTQWVDNNREVGIMTSLTYSKLNISMFYHAHPDVFFLNYALWEVPTWDFLFEDAKFTENCYSSVQDCYWNLYDEVTAVRNYSVWFSSRKRLFRTQLANYLNFFFIRIWRWTKRLFASIFCMKNYI